MQLFLLALLKFSWSLFSPHMFFSFDSFFDFLFVLVSDFIAFTSHGLGLFEWKALRDQMEAFLAREVVGIVVKSSS